MRASDVARLLIAAALAGAALAAPAGGADRATTLGDLVPATGAAREAAGSLPLAEPVSSSSVLADERGVVIAGVPGDGSGTIDEIAIFAFDAGEKRWRERRITEPPLGSVVRIDRLGELAALQLHLSPSAASTVVLDRTLNVRERLNGWIVATLPGGEAVFERSQVHFAPLFQTELFLYDPVRATSRDLFPRRDDPVRRRLETEAADDYARLGGEWCAAHNHPCDPHRIDSDLVDIRVVAERPAVALCFVVAYRRPVEAPPVVVRYRLDDPRATTPALHVEEVAPGGPSSAPGCAPAGG